MDEATMKKAEAATQGKSGVIDGPQDEIALRTSTPGQVPFLRPAAPNPTTESNK